MDDRSPRSLLRGRLTRAGLSFGSAVASPLSKSEATPCSALQELPQRPASELGDSLPAFLCLLPDSFPGDLSPLLLCTPWLEVGLGRCEAGMGETARLPNGDGTGEAMRLNGAFAGSRLASSPSSSPEIRRGARGRREEEAAGVELVRTLLAFIAGQAAASRGMHVECRGLRECSARRGPLNHDLCTLEASVYGSRVAAVASAS